MENNHTTTPGPAAEMPRLHLLLGKIVIYRLTETEFRPALVVRAWSDTCAQLLVFPDGTNPPDRDMLLQQGRAPESWLFGGAWRTSVSRGESIGMWRLPEDFYPVQEALAELKTCEGKLCEGFTCVSEHPCQDQAQVGGAAFDPTKTVIVPAAENPCNSTALKVNINDQGQVESAEVVKLQEIAPANTVSCDFKNPCSEDKGPGGGGSSGTGSSFGESSKSNA